MHIKKQGFRLSAIALVVCLLALNLSGCTKIPVEKEVRHIKTQVVTRGGHLGTNYLSGNIVPIETVKVSFKTSGIISDVFLKEGETVKKGDVIAKMKPEDYKLAVDAAKSQWQSAQMRIDKEIPNQRVQAKAQLDLTRATYERVKVMYEAGAASKSDLDQITAKLTVDESTYQQVLDAATIAKTEVGQAKAGYDLSISNLESTTLISPIDGVVLKKIATTGETTASGYPVMVIGQVNQVWAEFGVTDQQLGQFKVGQKWPVYIYGTNESVEGIVDEVGHMADEKTRLFTLRLKLDNAGQTYKPGMVVKASLQKEDGKTIMIPFSSVIHFSEGESVYVYDSNTKTVKAKRIRTGNLVGEFIEVLEGLNEGELLVVEGHYQVTDGEQVVVND